MSDWKIDWKERHASEFRRVFEAASIARQWSEKTDEPFYVRYWPGEWSFYPDPPDTKYEPADVDGWCAVLIDGRAACPRGWIVDAHVHSAEHAALWCSMLPGGGTRLISRSGKLGEFWTCWWRP